MPPGNYFSAEVESGNVKRVKVMKVDRIKKTVHAFLIDYGYALDIPWQRLVPLDKEFWSVKANALKIELDGFVGYHNVDVLEFARKKLVGRRVFGREVNASLSQTVPLVKIFEADPRGDLMFVENLREQMRKINLGHAPPADGGSELGMKININNNISHEKTRAQAGTLAFPRLPEVGEFYDCVVSEVVCVDELHVQSYDNLASYKTLNRQMLAFYSANGSPIQSPEPGNSYQSVIFVHDFKYSPFSGQVIAACVGEAWSRAEVLRRLDSLLDAKDNQTFLVKLVDTGKVEIVAEGSMKVLQKEFLSLPRQVNSDWIVKVKLTVVPQAVRVKLEGLAKTGQEATVWLKHVCLGKSLVGLINTKQEDRLGLVMYDTSKEDLDINVNEELIALGLASRKD